MHDIWRIAIHYGRIPGVITSETYGSPIGLQWSAHAETQLGSRSGTGLCEAKLDQCLGVSNAWWRSDVVSPAGYSECVFTTRMYARRARRGRTTTPGSTLYTTGRPRSSDPRRADGWRV